MITLTIIQSAVGLGFASCKSSLDSSKGLFKKLQNNHLLSSKAVSNEDGDVEVSWLVLIFATIEKWMLIAYSITFAVLIKIYLI